MACPRCRQDAPLLYRGASAYCAACGARRTPFAGRALNLAGLPSRVGGRFGTVIGWAILCGGLLLALAAFLFFHFLLPDTTVSYAVSLPIALVGSTVGLVLLVTGSRLRRAGLGAERRARNEALWALALHRGGAVTAADAGRALGVERSEAEACLAALSESDPERVTLEVDDDGNLFYLFRDEPGRKPPPGAEYRVDADGRVRLADPLDVHAEDSEESAPTTRTSSSR